MKAAVIGAGYIARQHLGCLTRLGETEVVGVCDLSPAVAESTADRFGVPRWFTDYREMLEAVRPGSVHIVTPPTTHFRLAMDCLASGCHVLVEKPITTNWPEWVELRDEAAKRGRWVIEDHNYQFNRPVQRVLEMLSAGDLGEVVHLEGVYCLDIRGEQSPFADPNLPHPCLSMPGGAIGDFLPHLAYLVYLFAGPHRSLRTIWSKRDPKTPLPCDEFRAVIDCAGATASIGFTSSAGPDGFWFTLYCTKALVRMNLFENRLTINRKLGGPPPLVLYRETRREGREVRRSAWAGLKRKLSPGPGLYEGLYRLIERMYAALRNGESPPIPLAQIEHVRRLVVDLTDPENRL